MRFNFPTNDKIQAALISNMMTGPNPHVGMSYFKSYEAGFNRNFFINGFSIFTIDSGKKFNIIGWALSENDEKFTFHYQNNRIGMDFDSFDEAENALLEKYNVVVQ